MSYEVGIEAWKSIGFDIEKTLFEDPSQNEELTTGSTLSRGSKHLWE